MENSTDLLLSIMGIALVLLLTVVCLMKFIFHVYAPFAEERDFIRMEIMRTHGNEHIHWKHELRRLYLEQIPIIGIYLAEISRERLKRKMKEEKQ